MSRRSAGTGDLSEMSPEAKRRNPSRGARQSFREAALSRRLELERAVTAIATRFLVATDVDRAINDSLADIGKLSRASRAYLFLVRPGGAVMDNTHEWCAEGVKTEMANLQDLPCTMFPWWMGKLHRGEAIHIEDVARLPLAASPEKQVLQQQDIKSLIVLPLSVGGSLAGFIGFDNVVVCGPWRPEDISLLQAVSKIIAGALWRQRSETGPTSIRGTAETIVNSLGDAISIVNVADFKVVAANAAYFRQAGKRPDEVLGQTCYELTHGLSEPCSGVDEPCPLRETVVTGSPSAVEHLHCGPDETKKHSEIRTYPLTDTAGKVVQVLHVARDITSLKQKEAEATARSEQLAALYEVASLVNQSLDLKTVLDSSLKMTLKLMGLDAGIIFRVDEQHKELLPVGWRGMPPEVLHDIESNPPIKIGQGLSGAVASSGNVVAVEDLAQETKLYWGSVLTTGFKSFVGIPLKMKGRLIGVLTSCSRQKRSLSPGQMEMMVALGNILGTAIANAGLHAAVREAGEHRYRKLMESAHDAIFVADALSGTIVDCNQKAAEVLGMPRNDIVGLHQSQLHPPEDREEYARWFQESAMAGQRLRRDVLVLARNGSRIWVDIGASVYEVEGRKLIVGMFRDVTQRREAEARLKTERSTLEAIIRSMAEGLIVADTSKQVVFCNRAAEELLGLRVTDIVGRPAEDLYKLLDTRIVEPQDWRAALAGHFRQVDNQSRAQYVVQVPERREMEASFFAIEAEGTRIGTGMVLRDITREKEVDRMKSEFISIASHELRTPMTSVYGFSELLLLSGGLSEEHRSWAMRIHSESERLTGIIEDLLNVSRIESGRLALHLEPVVVRPVLDEVIDRLRIRYVDHSFMVTMADDLLTVVADREKTTQVLINLLDNAAKYSPGGREVRVTAGRLYGSAEAVIQVSDRGMGIPPDEMPRLFGRFHRVRNRQTDGIRGTGLGLYIVKRLAEQMRGRVWAESRPGEGSTFHVALPLAVAPPGDNQG